VVRSEWATAQKAIKKIEKLKSSARQGAFISEKIAMILTPTARWMSIQADLKFQKE
jgi:hypothetical protein